MNEFHSFIADKVECSIGKDFIHRDPKCGVCSRCKCTHELYLYYSEVKKARERLCKPDILVILQDKVIGILEIDKPDTAPVGFLGKFVASSLAKFYIPSKKDRSYYLSEQNDYYSLDNCVFIQVILLDYTKRSAIPEDDKCKWRNTISELKSDIKCCILL